MMLENPPADEISAPRRQIAPLAAAALLPWYVIRSEPQKERQAAQELGRLGLTTLFPCFIHQRPHRKWSSRPLFPTYFFAQLAYAEQWPRIQNLSYVSMVLTAESKRSAFRQPIIIPYRLIKEIRATATQQSVIRRRGGTPQGEVYIAANTKVRILSGPLAGQYALTTIDAASRISVMYSLFGMEHQAEFFTTDLEPVG